MHEPPGMITDRAAALRSCPARAPDPRDSRPPADFEVAGARSDPRALAVAEEPVDAADPHGQMLEEVIGRVAGMLDGLPEDQAAGWWVEPVAGVVVLQVTRDADRALAVARRLVDDPGRVAVERVRYSAAELRRATEVVMGVDDLDWTTLSCQGPNNRVEVGVRGDGAVAWQRIARVVDPCAFRVTGGVDVRPLAGGATDSGPSAYGGGQ